MSASSDHLTRPDQQQSSCTEDQLDESLDVQAGFEEVLANAQAS